MTSFEIKERLREYNRACRRCEELERQIIRRRAALSSPRAVRFDVLPGGKGNSIESAIERIDELERRLADEKSLCEKALDDVRSLIAFAKDDDGKAILSLRYIDGVSFGEIPERIHLSERSMWRKYDQAVEQIAARCEEQI